MPATKSVRINESTYQIIREYQWPEETLSTTIERLIKKNQIHRPTLLELLGRVRSLEVGEAVKLDGLQDNDFETATTFCYNLTREGIYTTRSCPRLGSLEILRRPTPTDPKYL